MAERILVNTEAYEALSLQLKKLSDRLCGCMSSLNSLSTGALDQVEIRLPAGSLQTVDASLSGTNATESLSSLCTAMDLLSEHTASLSRKVSQIKAMFDGNEHELTALYNAPGASMPARRSALTFTEGAVSLRQANGSVSLSLGGVTIASVLSGSFTEYNALGCLPPAVSVEPCSLDDLVRDAAAYEPRFSSVSG